MALRVGRWTLLAAWVAVIVFAVAPFGRYREGATWQPVAWVPFVSRPMTLRDSVVNILLYIPFGYLSLRASPRATAARILVHAMALSTATEAAQTYSRGRYPSATDVVCNVVGAMIGFAWARRRD